MDEKDNSRSSLQTAADLGRAAKAAYRIAQAAAVSGVHGAAAAAVKETVPALVKFLLAVLLIMIVIPMVVFTALPNIFFGYDSSDTASVIHMTEQAMRIGGAYMSLDDFERTQIDSIVTGIAAEYEADGTAIDHIEVKNTMKEDDLLWIIAINSAAYEQDLDAMSAELIQNFCQSTLSYQPSLSLLGGSTSATLEVEIKRIDPEELMEQMGFNEDARQWAGALFETLKDSGALEKYGGYFSAYQPDYSGDGSYSGDIQHGTSYDNGIDISRFVSPSTKNNLDLAAYAVQAWENNWGYVWGTYGNILTESLFAYKKQQYTYSPSGALKTTDTEITVSYTAGSVTVQTTQKIKVVSSSAHTGDSGSGDTTYGITVKSAKNGDVTASHKTASKGTTITLTVDPDKGYVLDALTVLDGKDKEIKLTEKNGKYTFTMPASKVTVEATFKPLTTTGNNPFIDVPAGSYYEDAVIWAVDKGITSGTSAVTFDPNGNCTRAQAVTFLWRAAGSPAPKTKVMSFTDVPSGSYYYDAVLWAMEQGITKGTSDTAFSPNASCTRAQIVTFLWRANGSPAVSGNSAFTDVASDAYYAAAVAWAEKNSVTGGIGGGLFGSGNNCTRAQIVTFIYRSVK